MEITTIYPDGRIETRPLTDDEKTQHEADLVEALNIAWTQLRNERNALLASCDWTQTADAPVDKYSWAEYRQQLRDLPAKTKDPLKVVWPTPPS